MNILIKSFCVVALVVGSAISASAQDCCKAADESGVPTGELLNLKLDARVDYQLDRQHSNTIDNESGFQGKYFNLRLDGSILPQLTYSWRQRFNKSTFDGHFFDATDWLYLKYQLKDWEFSAGKEVVAIGGWEYDRAPIDLYGCSVFWQNIPCYDLGVTVGYNITKSDLLKFQITQSPFFDYYKNQGITNRNSYSYNLMWQGRHGCFSSLWSANMVEYSDGRFISYLALGNKFDFNPITVELDLMNRAASGQTFFFKDCSVMGEISYRASSRWNVFAKMTYDVNKTHKPADYTVLPGTELTMAGAGVEFYPLKKKRTSLRLHATIFYSWGTNTNTSNIMQDHSLLFNVGVKWDMNLIKINRK